MSARSESGCGCRAEGRGMSEGEGRDTELFRCWRVWREEDIIVGRGGRWRG